MIGSRRRFRRATTLGFAGALGMVATVAWVPAAAAPTDETPVEIETPTDVVEWFRTQGPQAVELDEAWADVDLRASMPRPVGSWSPEFLAGVGGAEPVIPSDEWIAVLTRSDNDSREPVGTLRADLSESEANGVVASTDVAFAATLADLDPAFVLVYDLELDGWFALSDATVWPLTAEARELLVGAVPITTLQPFLAGQRVDVDGPGADHDPQEGRGQPTLVGMVIVAGVGAGAAAIVLRQLRRSDERLARELGEATARASTPGSHR